MSCVLSPKIYAFCVALGAWDTVLNVSYILQAALDIDSEEWLVEIDFNVTSD